MRLLSRGCKLPSFTTNGCPEGHRDLRRMVLARHGLRGTGALHLSYIPPSCSKIKFVRQASPCFEPIRFLARIAALFSRCGIMPPVALLFTSYAGLI